MLSGSRWKKRGTRRRLRGRQPERLHAVEAHAHADVPADDVGDEERTLHQRADLVALGDVLPPAGLGAPRRLARRTAPRSPRSRRRCTGAISTSSYFLRSRALVRSVRIMLRSCADSSGPSSARNTWADHSCTARSANSLGLSSTPTSALRRATDMPGPHRRPPLAGARRVEGVDAAQRIALHERLLVGGDLGDLVDADERVAADERRRRDRPAPPGGGAVGRVAPQRVVVAVGLGHVPEGVGGDHPVVRRLRPRLGHVDPRPQPVDAVVGDDGRRPLPHQIVVQRAAVGRLGLAAGAERAERRVDQQLAPPRRAEAEERLAPATPARRRAPRPARRRPTSPSRGSPRAGAPRSRRPWPPRRRRPARARAPRPRRAPSRSHARRAARRSCPAGTVTSSWAYTSPRTPSAISCSTDRVHGVGHDDAVDAAAAQRRRHRPPLGQRRVLVAAAAGLVGEVGGQARPSRRAPTCSRPRASGRSSRGWPTRRGTAGCAPPGRPGTSWPSCGAGSGRGCAR